jgi:riboflavin transporter FmnP
MNTKKNTVQIKRLCVLAMFCALAFALTYIKLPVAFLSLEIKDSAIVLATLLLGPLGGLSIAVLVPLLEMISHSTTGVYGMIMNMLSSVTFSMVTGLIYKYKKSLYGAVVGLVSGVFSVTAVMVLANLLVTPYYMGVSASEVLPMIPRLLLPFNFIKATLNGSVVLLLYKPLSRVLKRAKLLPSSGGVQAPQTQGRGRSVVISVVAVALIVISLGIILFVLK